MKEKFGDSIIILEGRSIGVGYPTFIIAEIGVNHNGDFELAKRHIEIAAECGVDAVKFQTFRAEEFMADRQAMYEYENGGKIVKESMYEMFKRLELPESWHQKLFEYARKLKVIPLTSVADPISAELAVSIGASALKISSEDLINIPLLKKVASLGLPLILSTGMADAEEIKIANEIIRNNGNAVTIFLHCVSVYPTPDDEAGIRKMVSLKALVNRPVGYSDHTIGLEASLAAISLGANIIEKHFTIDKNLPGPDHALSADPTEMKALVTGIRRIEKMLGSGILEPSKTELATRKQFRRSLVARMPLNPGHIISEEDVYLKRPGNGLRYMDFHLIKGKPLARAIKADECIMPSDLG